MEASSDITLSLTKDQALVLFEWLCRQDEGVGLPVEHRAERDVLWEVEAQLERLLVEPLRSDFVELVAAARERLVSDKQE